MINEDNSPLLKLFHDSFVAVDPLFFFKNDLQFKKGELFYKKQKVHINKNTHVLSFGKASLKMAQGLMEACPNLEIKKGLIVTHYEESDIDYYFPDQFELIFSSHPKFSKKSIEAGKKVLEYFSTLGEDDTVISLVSGGGSAMMATPRDEITMEEKIDFLNLMLFSGVGEREINVLRKALSKIKGGRLADAIFPGNVANFIISDERSHKLTAIASGPTLCNNDDPHPLEVVKEFHLEQKVPKKIMEIFKGIKADTTFGSKPKIQNFLVATREHLIEEIEKNNPFEDYQFYGIVGPKNSKEEKKKLIESFREFAQKSSKNSGLMVACGELPVIPVPGSKGGRNQHFALEVLEELKNSLNYEFLAMASDGCDYLKGIHGAVASSQLYNAMSAKGYELDSYIGGTKSFELHQKLGSLVKGGYSGTNVSDFFLFSFSK